MPALDSPLLSFASSSVRWLLILLVHLPAFGQAPRLSIESVDAQATHLGCVTQSDQPMTLQASFSLDEWYDIGTATPINGFARFSHAPEWKPEAVYYRVREGVAQQAPSVVPKLDLRESVTGILTRDEGARLRLETSKGLIFELLAGPNQVDDPTLVRMTLISNFVSFPAPGGWQAAVNFEPNGFRFRGDATLRITFPTNLPPADLFAYSFNADGSGFHLRQFDRTSNSVVMAIDGFSGKGVGNFSGGPPPSFSETLVKSSDASRAAQDRGARREARINKDRIDGRISQSERDARQRASRLQTLDETYRDAIRPFEAAARDDCNVARAIVTFDLENLIREWSAETGRPPGESPYMKSMLNLAAVMRCRCAHVMIERCEQEAGVSGSALLADLRRVLLSASRITGREDAQGCDLGTDDQILTRLESGPCFGDWEGTILMTRSRTISGARSEGHVDKTWNNEQLETYSGRITGVTSQKTFTVDGRKVQSWNLATGGIYAASRNVFQRTIDDDPKSDVIRRHTLSSSAGSVSRAAGTLFLSFVNGEFDALGVDALPKAQRDQELGYTTVEDTEFECRDTFPKDQECPSGQASVDSSSINLSLYQSIDLNTVPAPIVNLRARSFTFTWRQTERFDRIGTSVPPEFVQDTVVINLVRK